MNAPVACRAPRRRAASRFHGRPFSPALLLIGLASCGASQKPAETQLAVGSDAFRTGQPIPAQYTCDGPGQSPPINWGVAPPGTKSLALVVDDPDAPGGTFRHWGAYDIPAGTRSLAAGQPAGSQALNDFGTRGYGGPCPPKGDQAHHYHFKLYALDVDTLGLSAGAKVSDVEKAAKPHTVARGDLIGIYERRQ